MLQAFLMQRALALVSALLGGFGVFCVIYSFSTPHVAAEALILLGAALAVSYFSMRRRHSIKCGGAAAPLWRQPTTAQPQQSLPARAGCARRR